MNTFVSVLAVIVVIAHLVIVGFIWHKRQLARHNLYFLNATLLLSAIAIATYFLSDDFAVSDNIKRGFITLLILIIAIAGFGGLMIDDIMTSRRDKLFSIRIWSLLSAFWLLGLAFAGIADNTFVAGGENWLIHFSDYSDISALITIAGFLIATFTLLLIALTAYRKASLAQITNRIFFRIFTAFIFLFGAFFAVSGTSYLVAPGMALLLVGMTGAAYGELSYNLIDVRAALVESSRNITFAVIIAVVSFLAIYLAATSDIETGRVEGLAAMAGLALVIAVIAIPIRQLTDWVFGQLTRRTLLDHAWVVREYNAAVAEAVELDTLIREATSAINRTMQVKRSCLLLLNSTFKVKDAVEMLFLQPDSSNHQTTSFLSVFSPIYITLAVKRKPLTQYDIDYAPDYRAVDNQERDFFDNLGMSAYAPIIQGTAVIGFVGCGPKQSGAAYYARDLGLMETLAHQTGVAISNARLVDDLQHLNKALHSLNRTLRKTNADLERMDAVKTDFVTIASHELRTPLAQIRGYTDIIDALSEQGALDQNQTYTFINNLRKATERVEELIAAMLDVSQIDVNAMELHFTEASPDSLMRMAIEPLNDAMNQRKITLTAHGLKDLPTIHADLQRLVQAFRNLITNAIKFTPDGGKIEINGMFKKADSEAESDHILIEISDTGVGIPTENLELIFDKFFRGFDPALHSTGAYKFLGAGPGLGLTIARGVIEGHDGEIWAESPGQNLETYPGSTFFILLPVQRADDAPHIFSLEDTKIRTPN